MKQNKALLSLTCIALMSVATISYAETDINTYRDGRTLVNSSLFKDSKIEFSTVNKFQYLNSNDYPVSNVIVQTAWAQGIKADYTSGYAWDFLGLDASYTGVVKIAASDYFFTRQYLYSESSTNGLPSARNFSKFDQLYLKQKFGTDQRGVHFFEGRRELFNFGAVDSMKKVATTSFYGAGAEANLDSWSVRGAYLTKFSNADTPYESEIERADGGKVDYLLTGDIKYSSQAGSFLYFVGNYKDYLMQHGIEGTLNKFPYIFGTQLYMNHGLSDWRSMDDGNKGFDTESYHMALDMTWLGGPWFVKAGYAYTIAKKTDGLGKYLLATDNVNFNSMAHGLSTDFTNNKEHFLGGIVMYQFNPDYAAGLVGRFGYGHEYLGNHMQDVEIGLINKWTPSQLKNLTAFYGFGPNWTFKRMSDNTPRLDDNGHWIRGRGWCFTSSIEYKF